MRKIRNPAGEIPLEGLEGYHHVFLAERRVELELLKKAADALDFKLIAQMGHKWKGISAPYGFQELASLADPLEECALTGDLDKCKELLLRVGDYLGQE